MKALKNRIQNFSLLTKFVYLAETASTPEQKEVTDEQIVSALESYPGYKGADLKVALMSPEEIQSKRDSFAKNSSELQKFETTIEKSKELRDAVKATETMYNLDGQYENFYKEARDAFYRERLADPRLSESDRETIQKELETPRALEDDYFSRKVSISSGPKEHQGAYGDFQKRWKSAKYVFMKEQLLKNMSDRREVGEDSPSAMPIESNSPEAIKYATLQARTLIQKYVDENAEISTEALTVEEVKLHKLAQFREKVDKAGEQIKSLSSNNDEYVDIQKYKTDEEGNLQEAKYKIRYNVAEYRRRINIRKKNLKENEEKRRAGLKVLQSYLTQKKEETENKGETWDGTFNAIKLEQIEKNLDLAENTVIQVQNYQFKNVEKKLTEYEKAKVEDVVIGVEINKDKKTRALKIEGQRKADLKNWKKLNIFNWKEFDLAEYFGRNSVTELEDRGNGIFSRVKNWIGGKMLESDPNSDFDINVRKSDKKELDIASTKGVSDINEFFQGDYQDHINEAQSFLSLDPSNTTTHTDRFGGDSTTTKINLSQATTENVRQALEGIGENKNENYTEELDKLSQDIVWDDKTIESYKANFAAQQAVNP